MRIDEVSKAMAAITTSLQNIPTKREMQQHQDLMDDQLAKVEENNTGLTTMLEAYKVSESTPFHIEHQAAPSGTQSYMHPHRVAAMGQPSVSVSSLTNTESEISRRGRMRGGSGSNGAAGGVDGAAGGAD